MAKATRPLSGASQKKYFRDLIASIDGVSPEAAETLNGACEREIAQLRVRLPLPDRGKDRAKKNKAAPNQPEAVTPTANAGFDPYAFSVVVIVTKEGPDGLARKLREISSAVNLRALAKAQHVAIPEADIPIDDLRTAIVEGALQRVANRKAAGS